MNESNFSERLNKAFSKECKNFTFDYERPFNPGYPASSKDYDPYDFEDPYDYDPYENQFTDEEKNLVTLACYIISNINYAMRHLDRGTGGSECEPTLDKAYRVLEDPTHGKITNEIFNINRSPSSYKPMPEYPLLSSIMEKIRINYGK